MNYLKKSVVYVASVAFVLSGCVTNSGSSSIGPRLSSFFGGTVDARVDESKPKLDVIVSVFDPGIPEDPGASQDPGTSEESGGSQGSEVPNEQAIWPDLRRAEANRFAYKLKLALEETGAFGAVRVTPDRTATGDLYIAGTIRESDGEDVKIGIKVFDISGRQWIDTSFSHSVEDAFHNDIRNKGKDPYDPVFEKAATTIAALLHEHTADELVGLTRLTDLRFGASFSEQAFNQHLVLDEGRFKLTSFPSDDDPMLVRTRAIRVRDQLFVDGLQDNYRSFNEQMTASYLVWQKQSMLELQAAREARLEAAGEALLGILAIGLAVVAGASAADASSPSESRVLMTGSVAAGIIGASLLQGSFQTSKEVAIHRDALKELGQSIDIELAPRVIEMEKETVKLTGSAKEQFAQWRKFLQMIYAKESTPNVQL